MKQSIIILYGISGSGKSTIGKLLSDQLNIPFYDGDDFHPVSNVSKMSTGISLTDEDRFPWLEILADKISTWSNEQGAVLACSALKEKYRTRLSGSTEHINWILLEGSYELIKNRMDQREDHYMKSSLLQSQFDTLEIPNYGLRINIDIHPEEIVKTILSNIQFMNKSSIGIIGLGVMGRSISLNIADNGFSISVFNRSDANEAGYVQDFLSQNASFQNIKGFTDLKDFVGSLERPRKVFLMIKAGSAIDHVIEALLDHVEDGDIIIDGGNSLYHDTNSRYEHLKNKGIKYIGCGVSGGEKGARFGPSIMPGGDMEAYEHLEPLLESIAAKDDHHLPCCTYIGPQGAGHFVKMVHNGIEYAEMQLLAECYAILKMNNTNEEISAVFNDWNQDKLSSCLLQISAQILMKKEGESSIIDLILDQAANKGTGSWSTKAALDLGVPTTMMSTSVFARYLSSFKSERVDFAKAISTENKNTEPLDLDSLKQAYQIARIVNHHQGFDLIRQASEEYNWNLNLSEIARIWTNGCIIRSSFMNEIIEVFKTSDSLLKNNSIFELINKDDIHLQKTLQYGIKQRIALPCFSAAFQYWLSMTTENLPANLIQAQRDFFGAHTFKRTDKAIDESFHIEWE